jgi:hypothetical protein
MAGFDTSGIQESTAREMAAAVDDILGKYPFVELAGIEVSELPGGAASLVVRKPNPDDTGTAPWIVLDRAAVSNPELLVEKVRAATQSGDLVDRSEERPMYSIMIGHLGWIFEEAAGPRPRQLAERMLITEYRRVSGPWDGTVTLAHIVGGYRRWRAQLSGGSFSHGRFQPRAALVAGFSEVELFGENACGPAKALHRLVVEDVRGRSDA